MIDIANVTFHYQSGNQAFAALKNIHLHIPKGMFAVLAGRSGSGKSTLLNLIGGLEPCKQGQIKIDGQVLNVLSMQALDTFRLGHIGFIFQDFGLLPSRTALENVELPLAVSGVAKADRRQRAADMLARVGLADKANNRPDQLSGGQQQRVSIARALINQSPLILADEPTANLDMNTSKEVLQVLRQVQQTLHSTILVATHDPDVIAQADMVIRMQDGAIIAIDHPASQANAGGKTA